jgi:HPt (histidine-containing phosphotransfer) domain-containing protein
MLWKKTQPSNNFFEGCMSKFTVVVDPDLEEIIPRYMEIRLKELASLEQAVNDEDGEAVRMLGHKLKGTGASYGFDALTKLGSSIEVSGSNGEFATAEALAAKVRSFLENVEVVYGK